MNSGLNHQELVFEHSLLPNWEKAEIHARAVSVGRPIHIKHNSEDNKEGNREDNKKTKQTCCECCNNVIEREHMDVGTNIKNLSFLGFGVPLFYLFLQYCIILNLLLVLTDGIMMTTEAIQNNSRKCSGLPASTVSSSSVHHFMAINQHHLGGGADEQAHKLEILCSNKFVFISNVHDQSSTAETVARISSFIIQILFLIYVKNSLMKTGEYYNEISVDLSDYSVIFKGLPKHIHEKKNIFYKIVFAIRRQGNQFNNFMIITVPQNERLEHLLHEKQQLNEKYLKLRLTNQEEAREVFKKYQINHRMLKQQIVKSKQALKNDSIESENVIIVFETEEDRECFMSKKHEQTIYSYLATYFGQENAKNIEVSKCSDPKEIMWHHLQHFSSRKFKIFYGWLLSLVFLFVILVIFYFLSELKARLIIQAAHEAKNNPEAKMKQTWAAIIAWATLIGIVLFNKFIMGPVLHYFTHLEHHDDKANDDFSFAFKYALGMFFTTCLMTITIEAVMHKNYYSHPFGIVEQESLMFIFSSILVPLIWLIHPLQLSHQFSRWAFKGTNFVTQKEANHLMADYEYSVGKRYAQILEMMWFAFLYVDLIPAGTLSILIGVCAYYWVDKYNLLNRSSAPHNISVSLSLKIVRLLDLTLVFRFAGEILFDYQLKRKVDPISVILLGFSIVFLFLPWGDILNAVAGEQFKLNEKKLSDVYNEYFLQDNYIDKNPFYHEIEITQAEKQQLLKKYNPTKPTEKQPPQQKPPQ